MTPSAVSHQIKSLEEFLKVKLFRREKRKVLLTTAGEKYLRAIEHALDEIDIATRRLSASPNMSAVNISIAPAFLTRWLVPRIGEFQQLYPDIELRLSASNTQIDFNHSDTDMVIYYGRNEWENVESTFLRSVTLIPVCSPRLMTGKHPLEHPEDLSEHTLIHVASRLDEWETLLEKLGINMSSCGKGLTFSSTSLAIGAAIEGLGITLADVDLIEKEVEYGQLMKPFDIQLETQKGFYLVYQKKRQMTYGMQAFYDWITAAIDPPIQPS